MEEYRKVPIRIAEDPLKQYADQLAAYLRSPREVYLLGAFALLRNIIDILAGEIDRNLGEEGRSAKDHLRDLRTAVSRPLHYQGFRGGDPLSKGSGLYMQDPLHGTENGDGKTLGEYFLYCLDRFCGEVDGDGILDDVSLEIFRPLKDRPAGKDRIVGYGYLIAERPEEKERSSVLYRFLGSLSKVLEAVDREKEPSWVALLSMAAAARTIAEARGSFLSWKYKDRQPDGDKKDTGKGKDGADTGAAKTGGTLPWAKQKSEPTMESYTGFLEKRKKQIGDLRERNELMDSVAIMKQIQERANNLLDEADKKDPKAERGRAKFGEGRKAVVRMNTAVTACLETFVREPIPASVKSLLEKYRLQAKKLKRRTAVKRILLAPLIVLAFLAAAVIFTAFFYRTPTTVFCSDYVWRNGLPEGIGILSEREAKEQVHYRITSSSRVPFLRPEGIPTELAHEDAFGNVIDEELDVLRDRAARIVIHWTDALFGGGTGAFVYYDSEGRVLYRAETSADLSQKTYSHPDTGLELQLPFDVTDIDVYRWTGPGSGAAEDRLFSKMDFSRQVFDDRGRVQTVNFRRGDTVYTDGNGVAALGYSYDELGRITAVSYTYDEHARLSDSGIYIPGREDGEGDRDPDRIILREIAYTDMRIHTVRDTVYSGEILMREYAYDGQGRCIRESFSRNGGKPYMVREKRYDRTTGKLVDSWTTDGSGTYLKDEDGAARCTYLYDEQGRLIRTERCSDAEHLLSGDEGWAVYLCEYASEGETEIRKEYYQDDRGRVLDTPEGYVYAVTETSPGMSVTRYYDRYRNMAANSGGYYQYRKTVEDNGETVVIEFLDQYGHLVVSDKGYAGYTSRYRGMLLVQWAYYDDFRRPVDVDGRCGVEREYNAKRQVIRETYSTADGGYYFGINVRENKYDDAGRLERITYYADGVPEIHEGAGYATVVYEYDAAGNRTQGIYYDANRQILAVPRLGYAMVRAGYSEKGESLWWTYYDAAGAVTVSESRGYATCRCRYDEYGNRTSVMYYDAQDDLIFVPDAGCAGYETNYTPRGEVLDRTYYGADGNEMILPGYGYAKIVNTYENGKKTSTTFYDEHGGMVVNDKLGYARVVDGYDGEGHSLGWTYYGPDGKMMYNEVTGYARIKKTVNRDGDLTEVCYYDADGDLMIARETGYALVGYRYDGSGNLTECAYYDEKRERMIVPDLGYARIITEYDLRGRKTGETYYGTDDLPVLPAGLGYAKKLTAYTEKGDTLSVSYYDAAGNAVVPDRVGYAECRYEYDVNGFLSGRTYYGADGRMMRGGKTGYARYAAQMDGRGNRTVESYFDADGKEMVCEEIGYAKIVRVYDGEDRVIRETYFGADGLPMVPQGKDYASAEWEYDGNGNTLSCTLYDREGRQAVSEKLGYARVVDEYDPQGFSLGWTYYGADGQVMFNEAEGYARVTKEVDKRGNVTGECYYDADGDLCMQEELGYARIKRSYDELGRWTGNAYYGPDGEPMTDYEYAKLEYDDNGNKTGIGLYDAAGRLVVSEKLGYARATVEYDDEGRTVGWTYYGPDGEMMFNKVEGYARLFRAWDARGNEIEVSFYGADGELCLREEAGCARIVREYDGADRLLREAYFGADGEPMTVREKGYASVKYEYDDRGNRTATSFFGENGQSVVSEKYGYARAVDEYDGEGRSLGWTYYGPDGEMMFNEVEGYARVLRVLDEQGREIEISYHDADGGLCMQEYLGWARIVYEYDGQGEKTGWTVYGEDGEEL